MSQVVVSAPIPRRSDCDSELLPILDSATELAWKEVVGLPVYQALDYLDWLENHGIQQIETRMEADGTITIRWQDCL